MYQTYIRRGDIVRLRFDFEKHGPYTNGMRVRVVHVPERPDEDWCFDNGKDLIIMDNNTPGLRSITRV